MRALPIRTTRLSRNVADFGLWAAMGVIMAILGPFGSSARTLDERLIYWLACMVGGGVIGVVMDLLVVRVTRAFWPRVLAVSVLMTPGVTLLVGSVNTALAGMRPTPANFAAPAFEVFTVCFVAMCLRQLVWAEAPSAPDAAQPEPERDPTETFRRRLSAKRRAAILHAVEAEDHYLRVHTDAGEELITARFADALDELADAPGYRIHRSWWVAADAIDQVRWRKGAGEARLKCGLTAPVSRSQAPALRAAGWF